MAAPEIRNEIDNLKAEMDAVRHELSLRWRLIKEDFFTGFKILVAAGVSYFGVKFALRFVRTFLGLLWKLKFAIAATGCVTFLVAFAWYQTLKEEQ